MPARPPFWTPTRTPTIGRPALAITDLMRSAAASVSRIIWGLSRAVAIMFSEPVSNRNRLNLPNYFALNVGASGRRSEEHTSELQSHLNLVCRLLLEKKRELAGPHSAQRAQRIISRDTTSWPSGSGGS